MLASCRSSAASSSAVLGGDGSVMARRDGSYDLRRERGRPSVSPWVMKPEKRVE